MGCTDISPPSNPWEEEPGETLPAGLQERLLPIGQSSTMGSVTLASSELRELASLEAL